MKLLHLILNLFLKKSTPQKLKKETITKNVSVNSRNVVRSVASRKITDHFYESEFECKCGQCKVKGSIDLELVKKLQKVRIKYGQPIRITSGFRCEEHNKRVGGSPNSRHLFGEAADVTGEDLDTLYKLLEEEFLAIGDGRLNGKFIHVDLRSDRRRRWTY